MIQLSLHAGRGNREHVAPVVVPVCADTHAGVSRLRQLSARVTASGSRVRRLPAGAPPCSRTRTVVATDRPSRAANVSWLMPSLRRI